jgi:hypothetical protein
MHVDRIDAPHAARHNLDQRGVGPISPGLEVIAMKPDDVRPVVEALAEKLSVKRITNSCLGIGSLSASLTPPERSHLSAQADPTRAAAGCVHLGGKANLHYSPRA